MFSVQQKYRSKLGEIRLSQAAAGSHLRNKTGGIALKYVYQGAEHYQLDGQTTCVGAGQLMILREDRKFEANTDQSRIKAKGICIDLDADFVLAEIPDFYEYDLLFELPFQGQSFLELPQSFAHFAQHNAQPAQDDADIKKIRKELALLVALIKTVQPGMRTQAKKASTQKHLLAKLFKAKDFIHQHYRTTITLSTLARQVGISTYHFTRVFQACFAQSPYELQRALRMQAALAMMKSQEQSLAQIAYALGYCDQASFSNQFKQYHQESPSVARKRLS